MTTTLRSICLDCIHLHEIVGIGWTCNAFPFGIPMKIVRVEHDHRRPFEGDHGITFEPIEGAETSADPEVPIPGL